jgi:hypothetical protein
MLITFNTPQTSEKPTAMQAYSAPSINPFSRTCA